MTFVFILDFVINIYFNCYTILCNWWPCSCIIYFLISFLNVIYCIMLMQFLIFKPLNYCFKQMIGFDAKAPFASRPLLCLIRWCNKPGDITKEFWEKALQFHGTFHGLKITNWVCCKIYFYLLYLLLLTFQKI